MNKHRIYSIIGARLKERRKQLKIKQEVMARELHMQRSSIANIEAGKQGTPLDVLYRMCDILKVDIRLILPSLQEIQVDQLKLLEKSNKKQTASFVRKVLNN